MSANHVKRLSVFLEPTVDNDLVLLLALLVDVGFAVDVTIKLDFLTVP